MASPSRKQAQFVRERPYVAVTGHVVGVCDDALAQLRGYKPAPASELDVMKSEKRTGVPILIVLVYLECTSKNPPPCGAQATSGLVHVVVAVAHVMRPRKAGLKFGPSTPPRRY